MKNGLIEDSIAETLLISLYTRYIEGQRDGALFHDHTAARIIHELDYDFSKFDHAEMSLTAIAIRTKYFDDVVREFIEQRVSEGHHPIVVIIGCGLDTRIQRLGEVADQAHFYELDLPEVMALRSKFIAQAVNTTYLAESVFNTQWMDNVSSAHPNGRFLFVIEGVCMYFDNTQVKSIFTALAQRFSNSEILCDVFSQWMLNNQKMHEVVENIRADFKSAVHKDTEFECYATNLKHISTRYYPDAEAWKRLGFLKSNLMRLMPRVRKGARLLRYAIQ